VNQGILDDVLVGLGTRLLVEFGSCGMKESPDMRLRVNPNKLCTNYRYIFYLCTRCWREWMRWWSHFPNPSLRCDYKSKDRKKTLLQSLAWRRSHDQRMRRRDEDPQQTRRGRCTYTWMKAYANRVHKRTCTHTHTHTHTHTQFFNTHTQTQRDVVKQGQTLLHNFPTLPVVLHYITLHIQM